MKFVEDNNYVERLVKKHCPNTRITRLNIDPRTSRINGKRAYTAKDIWNIIEEMLQTK